MGFQLCFLLCMFSSSGQLQIQGEAELDIEMIREREEALRQLEVKMSYIYINIYAQICR